MQPPYDEILVRDLDGRRDPYGGGAGVLLYGEPGGGTEEPGVAVGAASVGAALGDGVHHLNPTLVGGCDQPRDVVEGARGAGGRGEFGQGAVRSHDPLLAFDGQQYGGVGGQQRGEPFLGFSGRHGAPPPSGPPPVRCLPRGASGIAPRGKRPHAF